MPVVFRVGNVTFSVRTILTWSAVTACADDLRASCKADDALSGIAMLATCIRCASGLKKFSREPPTCNPLNLLVLSNGLKFTAVVAGC